MPRFRLIAALATAAALIAPAAASAQAPAPNPTATLLAAQQQTANNLEAQIKRLQTEMQGRNQEIARLQQQVKALSPVAAAPLVARIQQLQAQNQTAMIQLQALVNRWNDAMVMMSNTMAKLGKSINAITGNLRP
jgi:chromosome segregation ATPase